MFRYLVLLSLGSLLYCQPSSRCAPCHQKITQTYARTGMGRSFYRSQAIEETKYFHEPSATWYAMLQRDGKTYQRRWRIGPRGEEILVREDSVDYVMGSGNHVRTYLHRTARGTLAELPLSWYAENGGTWAMSPGHDRDYMLPPRQIAYECMFCHNAYPRIPVGHEEPESEPVYASIPEGIDCERCHGGGDAHIRTAQTAGATVQAIRTAIVNPARLSTDRQLEVCMQCHLETTSLQLPHSIQRYGRGPFTYKPGEPLGNFQIYFDHAPGSKYRDDFEIVNSAYRLRQSQCFLRSGKMTCTTCHNPHDVPRGQEAEAHYNGACASCHGTLPVAHTRETGCVSCHMPKRRTVDVVHAVMTDHRIQRRPPAGDLVAAIAERQDFDGIQYKGEVVPYYPTPLPPTPENALYTAVAQVTHKSNLVKGLPRLAAEIERQKPVRPEFYIELGQGWLAAGKPANAVAPLQEALRRKPDSSVAALSLAGAFNDSGQAARALPVLNQTARTAANEPLLWYQLGITHTTLGQDDQAIAALEKAVALDPDFVEAHNLLGGALADRGDLDRAGVEFLKALQINPDFAPAEGNYGHLLAAQRDFAGACFYLARSVKLKPDDAETRTNYAVALAGVGQLAGAKEQIEAALQLDPKSAESHNLYGTLLEREGKKTEALREYLEAVRLRPDFESARRNAARLK